MKYFNEDIERMPIADLRKLQLNRLQNTIHNVYQNIPYYKNLFDSKGLKPSDIKHLEDIYKLPFTKKVALRDEYPFGLFTKPTDQLARLHCSSGTTGKPIVVGYTKNDIEVFSEVVARSLTAAGCKPGMILQNAYGYGLFTGGLGLHYGAEKMGMCVLPISGGGTEKQIMLMQDFKTSAICCTPSYACTLAEALHHKGVTAEELSLKVAILGAEPWTETSRQKVEIGLGVTATNIYGLSEIMGPGVSQEDYEEKGTGSYIWEDHFYPEVVDKNTGEPLPYGEKGVLVFTSLTKEAMPMLRYYTNDIAEIYYDKSAKRTHIKMSQIYGRADDMLIIRGVNLFPTQVEAILQYFEKLSPHYQLEVSKDKDMDNVKVKVEITKEIYQGLMSSTMNPLEHETITQQIAHFQKRIKEDIGLSMHIECCVPNSLPRSEGGKLSKIIDLR
jgi:phenylacetate-CoA ligase